MASRKSIIGIVLPSMLAYLLNTSTLKARAGITPGVQGQSEVHSESTKACTVGESMKAWKWKI